MAPSLVKSDKITVAVVTGRHPYDVPGFQGLFRALQTIDFYPQHMEDFVSDVATVRAQYDVVVFYHCHQGMPCGEGNWWEKDTKRVLESLGETSQGIFVLHHALLAFTEWTFWNDLIGLTSTEYEYHEGQTLQIDVAEPSHPITRGLESWEMIDETYKTSEPRADCHVLLTTDHPLSMRALAWTRRHRNARVFCLQPGHDNGAYVNPSFRTIMARGIGWCARRL